MMVDTEVPIMDQFLISSGSLIGQSGILSIQPSDRREQDERGKDREALGRHKCLYTFLLWGNEGLSRQSIATLLYDRLMQLTDNSEGML